MAEKIFEVEHLPGKELVLHFKIPKGEALPADTKSHALAACRELLLAMRGLVDAGIESLESLERAVRLAAAQDYPGALLDLRQGLLPLLVELQREREELPGEFLDKLAGVARARQPAGQGKALREAIPALQDCRPLCGSRGLFDTQHGILGKPGGPISSLPPRTGFPSRRVRISMLSEVCENQRTL